MMDFDINHNANPQGLCNGREAKSFVVVDNFDIKCVSSSVGGGEGSHQFVEFHHSSSTTSSGQRSDTLSDECCSMDHHRDEEKASMLSSGSNEDGSPTSPSVINSMTHYLMCHETSVVDQDLEVDIESTVFSGPFDGHLSRGQHSATFSAGNTPVTTRTQCRHRSRRIRTLRKDEEVIQQIVGMDDCNSDSNGHLSHMLLDQEFRTTEHRHCSSTDDLSRYRSNQTTSYHNESHSLLQQSKSEPCLDYHYLSHPQMPTTVPSYPDWCQIRDDRILQNLLKNESKHLPDTDDYLRTIQSHLNPSMRKIVADWMLEVVHEQNSPPEVFCVAMNLFDRFLCACHQRVAKSQLQLLGTVCLLIASKVREACPLSGQTLIVYTDNSITSDELKEWELLLLNKLQWEVCAITPLDFLDHTTPRIQLACLQEKRCSSADKNDTHSSQQDSANSVIKSEQTNSHHQGYYAPTEMSEFRQRAETILVLCATHYQFAYELPSVMTAGALYIAGRRCLVESELLLRMDDDRRECSSLEFRDATDQQNVCQQESMVDKLKSLTVQIQMVTHTSLTVLNNLVQRIDQVIPPHLKSYSPDEHTPAPHSFTEPDDDASLPESRQCHFPNNTSTPAAIISSPSTSITPTSSHPKQQHRGESGCFSSSCSSSAPVSRSPSPNSTAIGMKNCCSRNSVSRRESSKKIGGLVSANIIVDTSGTASSNYCSSSSDGEGCSLSTDCCSKPHSESTNAAETISRSTTSRGTTVVSNTTNVTGDKKKSSSSRSVIPCSILVN